MQKRKFERVPFVARTVVETESGRVEASMANIALKGAMLEFNEGDVPPAGTTCSLEVLLNISDASLHFTGTVVHTGSNVCGIRFTSVDLESMVHLRRLLELNTGDAEKIAEELAALIE